MIQVLKFVFHVYGHISGTMMFYPQVNELQFSHWVEDVLAVVENLTDGPIVLVNQILHLQTSCSAPKRGSFSLTIN